MVVERENQLASLDRHRPYFVGCCNHVDHVMKNVSSKLATGLVLLSVVLTSCAQLLFRYAMQDLQLLDGLSNGGLINAFSAMPGTHMLMLALGIAFYALSMLSWIFALSRFDVSLAYPLLAISYVLVYVGAIALPGLSESASTIKMIGIGVIVIGVAVISLGEKRSSGISPERSTLE